MSEAEVLDAAKGAVRRRRAMWASGASAVAVVALAAGVAIAAPGGDDRPALRIGADITSTNPPPSSDDTEPNWPDGQTDATAKSGPRYDRAVTVFNKLLEVVPEGFESPNLRGKPGTELADVSLLSHQAAWNYEDDSWNYDATVPVVTADKVGRLSVFVRTPGNGARPLQTMCEVAQVYNAEETSSCQEVAVAGKQVSIATGSYGMAAWYRHPDGTEVMVSQAAEYAGHGYPALTEPPCSSQQLAELATDPRFHLD